ncbi:leucine-rich repeat domain-containing protein [Pararhodonellum marinum]|uniref:leucine-rich repeat domain-containing protein n=1 Tax=Pararhodonellum marinum TaxID=2755358 RepID=UPI00188F94CA|nr:leucine-rich repeat domain-containing protein [Pararhodonellum marinum]
MTRIRPYLFFLLFFFATPFLRAQDLGDYSKQEIKDFTQNVEDQMKFLEYFLNTVGSKETSARDKDVIIRESYKKIFRDEKVQVEDDLLLDRKVITNKDVTAYLKDIEFFFKDAQFNLKVREIKPFLRDNGELSFLVSLDRTLTATGLTNEKIENTKPRFIEVNVDKRSNELKIASVYTTKLSRDKELMEWWANLSFEWEAYFRDRFDFKDDSLTIEQIYKITDVDTLKLSNNTLIKDLGPIQTLRELKYLDISNTHIEELNPISNVTFLSYLDISNTPTQDVQFLKYSDNLTYLDISHTKVDTIDDLNNLKKLKTFKAEKTPLAGFSVLNNYKDLEHLNLKESGFNNLENIKELNQLKHLNISGNYLINFDYLSELTSLEELIMQESNLVDLSPLASLEKLRVVNISNTEVGNLEPLSNKPELRRIYADQTSIPEEIADEYARVNRSVLLIHNVESLESWWNSLPEGWKEVIERQNPGLTKGTPAAEELSTLVNKEIVDISNSEVVNLRPILKFKKIIEFNCNNTKVDDLSPLADSKTLVKLSAKNTKITQVEALKNVNTLETIILEQNEIQRIESLKFLPELKYLNIDHTDVARWEVQELIELKPEANIIFRTEELEDWWENLNENWKAIFDKSFDVGDNPNSDELHKMTASTSITINGDNIQDLWPLKVFINLRNLEINNVPLADVSALTELSLLEKLKISQAPVSSLEAFRNLNVLEELDLSNTAIEDLRPLDNLTRLKKLNLSGTGIKRLRGLENLFELNDLDISSTNVRTISPISNLLNIEKFICFNTRINQRQIDNFKAANPNVDVRYY